MGDQSYFVNMPNTMDAIIADSPHLTNGTFEFEDESYFSNIYVPLSKFPTPPPSTFDESTRSHSPDIYEDPDSPLLGPSIHLTNLMPTAVSLLDPSPSLVLSLLKRGNLPIEIIALAVSILDSLSSRFAHLWRRSLPLYPQYSHQNNSSNNYTFSPASSTPHIDSVRPEIIILSALTLAQKFLDDKLSSTSFWAEKIGQHRWTTEQIQATEFAIMENLRWRILPLWNEERLVEALEDMEMARRQMQAMKFRQARYDIVKNHLSSTRDKSTLTVVAGKPNSGTAQAMHCEMTKLWTPAETPSSSLETERQCGSKKKNSNTKTNRDTMVLDTRIASTHAGATREGDSLRSPRSYAGEEPFPMYTDPFMGGGD